MGLIWLLVSRAYRLVPRRLRRIRLARVFTDIYVTCTSSVEARYAGRQAPPGHHTPRGLSLSPGHRPRPQLCTVRGGRPPRRPCRRRRTLVTARASWTILRRPGASLAPSARRHGRVEVRLLRRGRRPALLALGKHVATFFSTFACNLGWSVSSTFRDICLEIKSNAVTRATCREHVGTFTLAALVGHTRGGGPL